MIKLKSRNVAVLTGSRFYEIIRWISRWRDVGKNIQSPVHSGERKSSACMLSDVNFEATYATVMDSGDYLDNEKKAFTEAVRHAFTSMHKNIIDRSLKGGL